MASPAKPEIIDAGPLGQKQAYYTYTDKYGTPTYPDSNRPHYFERDLPVHPGARWTKYKNTKGEVYFIEQSASVIDPKRAQQAELDKREAEKRARDRVEAEAAAPKGAPQFRPGEQSGMESMREQIEYRRKQLGEIVGGKLSVSAFGQSKEIISAGVSTSVKEGTELGPATVGADGKLVAMDLGAAKVTDDGRIIAGKSVSRAGVKITAKGAVNVSNAVQGSTATLVETTVDALDKRLPGLGTIKGE